MFRGSVAAAGAAAFAVLAALVAAGDLTSIDQWAIDHAMPAARFTTGKPTIVGALVPLWQASWHGVAAAVLNIVTLPAAFTVATVLVAACCLRLRDRRIVALAVAYVIGNVAEAVTKASLTRPPLHWHSLHLAAYDSSYPSGHTIRTVLLALAVAHAWPRLRRWAAAWAAASLAMIELGGLHVPSDIVGGLVLTAALVATTSPSTLVRSSTSRLPWRACRPSAPMR